MAEIEEIGEQRNISALAVQNVATTLQQQQHVGQQQQQRYKHMHLSRNRHSYLNLEIPPLGFTKRSCHLIWLAISLFLLASLIILLTIVTIAGHSFVIGDDLVIVIAASLIYLLLLFVIVLLLLVVQRIWFRHETLNITIERYTLLKKVVPLRDIVNGLLLESYRSNIESGTIRLSKGRKSYGSRQLHLQAKVINVGTCGIRMTCIEFYGVYLGHLIPHDELQRAAHETNNFLRNTH